MTKRFNTTLHLACAILMVILCLAATSAPAQDPTPRDIPPGMEDWCGTYADGTPLCYEELMGLIEKHQRWLARDEESRKIDLYDERLSLHSHDRIKYLLDKVSDPQTEVNSTFGANLKGVNLEGVNLEGADLSFCNLSFSNLKNINLSEAIALGALFTNSNLEQATLTDSKLLFSSFVNSTMYSSIIINSNCAHTDFSNADLSNAILTNSHFTFSKFINTTISQATLVNTHLGNTEFEPKSPFTIQSYDDIAYIQWLKYPNSNYEGILNLRSIFLEDGNVDLAHEASVSIFRDSNSESFMYPFYALLFDWTCQYGITKTRPVRIMLYIWLALLPAYLIAGKSRKKILFMQCRTGDYAKECLNNISNDRQSPCTPVEIFIFSFSNFVNIRLGRQSSLLAIFRILKRETYPLPNGWIKLVATLQTIFGIYLLLLSMILAFFNPFAYFI